MGYDLIGRNKINGDFAFGAFSFPILLEACGYLFPCIHNKGQWFCVFGVDKRMPKGDNYPRILSNDGFEVTEEEAKIMARIARNFVIIQENIEEKKHKDSDFVSPLPNQYHWPMKIRDDFVDKFRKFADWAEKSKGFKIL